MYVPAAFRETRIDTLHEMMSRIGAAVIVGQDLDGLVGTHVPIELDRQPEPLGTIRCHFARANPHSEFVSGREVLLIFQGPQGYVTPSWYPSKHQTGKVVPTWNYVAVHAYGTATTFAGGERLLAHLSALTDHQESGYRLPWKLADAPKNYIEAMCRAIIGIEIKLTRIEGKWKLSQNRSEDDRIGVINGLRALGDHASKRMADLVEAALASKT
jgi:transcriptional regulator